jgi:hypothetical protein
MEIIIKNRHVSPLPQESTRGHESCLPARDVSPIPELVDVIENSNTIKSKKKVIKLDGIRCSHTSHLAHI